MEIRQEHTADHEAVYQVVKEAFAHADHTDGHEQDLVVDLRKSNAFIPELSLVAVEGDKVVGHILFTKAVVNQAEVLALAPLAVLPEYQGKGIGLALVKQGHKIAAELGYRYSVVLGHPKFYPKAGYIPASRYGIVAPFPVKDENFMATCLCGDGENLNGTMEYDAAFGIEQP